MCNRDPTFAACMLLFLLLLSPITPKCRKGTADECRKALFVPGADLIGSTIDITRLEEKQRWADIYQSNTPLVDCTLCENPLLEGKPLQRLPPIVSSWKAHIPCQQKVQHSVQPSVTAMAKALTEMEVKNDWRNELDMKISPSANTQWALAGSSSEWIKECIRISSEDKYMFLFHYVTCSQYKFHVGKDRLLNSDFEHHLNSLPAKYDLSSKSEYQRLIASYGTHFVTEMDVGASSKYLSAVSVCEAVMEGVSVSEISRFLAISLGIDYGFDGVKSSPDFQMCEEMKKNPNFFNSLHIMSNEISGGFFFFNSTAWMDSAKSMPALLSYALEPLHALVDRADPRREGLRQAVSEYVSENALWRKCTQPCPLGSQPSTSDFCSCECPNNNFTNSMCCSQKRGLAKLKVTILRAENLWGDIITHSDAYVSVLFQKRRMGTRTVWNNNNPVWNVELDFGVIEVHEKLPWLKVEVWDEDSGWDNDLLGSCTLKLDTWTTHGKSCYLSPGKVYFNFLYVCGPHLSGPSCRDYFYPPSQNQYHYQHY